MPNRDVAQSRGKQAEQLAARHLRKRGLKIIETNFLAPGGEVDIIARDKQTLVFVEVRYRASERFGSASETIDAKKQQRVIKAATHYLQQQQLWDKIACRFDTICLTDSNTLMWEQAAFEL